MLIRYILLISIIITSFCQNEEILSIPDNVQSYKIETKYGIINFELENESLLIKMSYLKLQGIKNLNRYYPPEIEGVSTNVRAYRNEIIFAIYGINLNIINDLICDVLYGTNYINKKVYSIGYNQNNELYKYFGGTPKSIVKDLKQFVFTKYEIPEINLISKEGLIYYNPEDRIEFSDKIENNCASFTTLNEFRDLFFDIVILRMKIGDNVITLKVKNENPVKQENNSIEYNFSNCPCKKWVLGLRFLELVNVREFDLKTGEVTLYLNNDNNLIETNTNFVY